MNFNNIPYLLTFELNKKDNLLEIHANTKGLKRLRDELDFLLKIDEQDHVHLMSPAWGGEELSNEKQNSDSDLINHVKIFKWDD